MTTTTAPVKNAPTVKTSVPPKVDIYESPADIVIYAEMSGVDETSVDITLEEGVLTIKGETKEPEFEGYSACRLETSFPNYERRFKIYEVIDSEQIEATLTDGVLKLQLPKAKKPEQKKIVVQKK